MDYLKIRNWKIWQSYRSDRGQPPWIKVHRRLMRNPEWVSLSDAERGQLVGIWLLGGDHDGVIPASPDIIQKLCYMSNQPDLNKFIDLGFIENGLSQDGVNLASDRRHDGVNMTRQIRLDKTRIDNKKIFSDADDKKPASRELPEPKKNKTTKKTDPRVKVFIDWWCRCYSKRFPGKKYAIPSGGKLGNQVKALLNSGLSWNEIQICAGCFLDDDEEFVSERGHDLGLLLTKIHKYNYFDKGIEAKYSKLFTDDKGNKL